MSLTLHNSSSNGLLKKSSSTQLFDDAVVLAGHQGAVLTSKFSPDGQSIASGGIDRTILLWTLPKDADDVSPNYGVLQGHKGAVTSLNWVLSSRIFATSADTTISYWDAQTGDRLRKGVGHDLTINDCAVAQTGECLSVSDDGTIKLWDEREKLAVRTIATPYPLLCCDVTRNYDTVICSGIDPTIRAYDIGTGKLLWSCEGHTDSVTGLALNTAENTLVLQAMDGSVRTINAKATVAEGVSRLGMTYEGIVPSGQQRLSRCQFSPDDMYIGLGSEDGTCVMWSTATRRMVSRWTGHKSAVLDIEFHPSECIFMSSSMDSSVILRAI